MKRKYGLIIAGVLLCFALIYILVVAKKGAAENPAQNDTGQSFTGTDDKGEEENVVCADNNSDPEDWEMDIQPYHTEQQRAEKRKWHDIYRNGANAKITFHVTDSEGRNVSNAFFHAGFIYNEESANVRDGKTDANGIFIAEAKTSYDVNYLVQKEDYYQTSATLYFSKLGGNDVVNGKWTPWDPTVTVTLKEKRNPVPMYAKNIELVLPKTNMTFGFDFKVGDLVAPHGKGEVADMLFTHTIKMPSADDSECVERITFKGASETDGTILLTSDSLGNHSSPGFPSVYDAPKEGYGQRFDMFTKWIQDKKVEDTRMTDDDYLVFRSRTTTDNNGQLTSAHYGKMYYVSFGRTRKNLDGGFVKMQYYFNPTPNDRNLEFDPSNNLFGNDSRNRIITP